MKDEIQMRQELIDYIKNNETKHVNTNFDNYTITALVVFKTEIEINLYHGKMKNEESKVGSAH